MNTEKQKALEAAGWVFEDAEDFLELTPEERAIVEMRVKLSRAVRNVREKRHMTQSELAKKLKTSQPRVNKIESGTAGVSLEQLLSSWFALGGRAEMTLTEGVEIPRAGDVLVDRGPEEQQAKKRIPARVKKLVPAKKTVRAK